MKTMEQDQIARKRAEKKFAFYVHAVIYTVVNLLLVLINLFTSPQSLWFIWPVIGWGLGLGFHGVGVFLHPKLSSIKEAMIQKELKKDTW